MKELKFKKISDRWYIDIPYDGGIEDLEMVSGADILLNTLTHNGEEATIRYYDKQTPNALQCTKLDENEVGATYLVDSWDCCECPFNGTIWLCNVTQLVLGEFPEEFYLRF